MLQITIPTLITKLWDIKEFQVSNLSPTIVFKCHLISAYCIQNLYRRQRETCHSTVYIPTYQYIHTHARILPYHRAAIARANQPAAANPFTKYFCSFFNHSCFRSLFLCSLYAYLKQVAVRTGIRDIINWSGSLN